MYNFLSNLFEELFEWTNLDEILLNVMTDETDKVINGKIKLNVMSILSKINEPN